MTLALKINDLKGKLKELKAKSPILSHTKFTTNSKLSAMKALNILSQNNENKSVTSNVCFHTEDLCKIFLPCNMRSIDSISDVSSNEYKNSCEINDSLSDDSKSNPPESPKIENNVIINDAQNHIKLQSERISVLARRNVFLEAKLARQEEEPKMYRGSLMKAMKIYAEIKNKGKDASIKNMNEFGCYCNLKMNKIDNSIGRGKAKSFKDFIDIKFRR